VLGAEAEKQEPQVR